LDSESCARRVAVRFCECLRFGLGMFFGSQLSALSAQVNPLA